MPTLEFKGKPFVYSHHLSVPFRELVIDPKKSLPLKGQKASLDDNLIIHGDNLEALKALLPRYAGKVDVVYIDPPYNTGDEGWAYNDNVNSPLMKEWLGKVVDRDDLERHDKWLCMMWPRISLLRELLSSHGVMFISINSIEKDSLGLILREIFKDCLLGEFVWKSRQNKDNRNKSGISEDHEYVLVVGAEIKGEKRKSDGWENPDNDPRGPWASGNMVGMASKKDRPNLHYDLIDPKTKINYGCPSRGWRYEPATMQKLIAEGRILWPPTPNGRPREKVFRNDLTEFTNASSVIDLDVFTRDGTLEFEEIFGSRELPFPKPSRLIEYLIELPAIENACVLDSFAGSGTTAQAVLALNKRDGGARRFILVEMEDYADRITAERIRRVIKGVPNAKDEALKGGFGGSFTYCRLGQAIDLERFFDGEGAPLYQQVAHYIVYTATGQSTSDVPSEPREDWFVAQAGGYRIYLIYRPNLEFMRSNQAALSMPLAQKIAKSAKGAPSLVYAASKFMAQAELTKRGITFCQLPYSVHRVLGEAPDAS
ncbi:MAG TPA: DNA methyltransferase [Roseiarcus sp.]|nr:DNA methyltransferase [Roseiarcus sp.]